MKKAAVVSFFILLIISSTSSAVPVEGFQQWGFTLDPGIEFTCLAYYLVADIGGLSVDLSFTLPPEWTSTFNGYSAELGYDNDQDLTWTPAVTPDGKIAYFYSDEPVANNTGDAIDLFSYILRYQWDDEALGYNEDFPIYEDILLWNGDTVVGAWGENGSPTLTGQTPVPTAWPENPDENPDGTTTWEDIEEEYTNPVPLPSTIVLFGLGSAILLKKKRQ